MSRTPLTDAAEYRIPRLFAKDNIVVDADFARGLEVELNNLKGRNETLWRSITANNEEIDQLKEEIERLELELSDVQSQLDTALNELENQEGADFEEGDQCPECHDGLLGFGPPVNCSCHLGYPPCSACVNNPLVCLKCGWEVDQ